MFHALQSALAPDVPLVVDFRHHWSLFLRYYSEQQPLSSKSQPVERTNLVHHLNKIIKLLSEEQEKRVKEDTLGPCMEYLINRQMLDIFSSLCQADSPPGIRPYLINLFVFMLTKIRTTVILPYVNVYFPMRRLLMLSSVTKASPTEQQELQFVTSLVSKLKGSPELLTLFAHQSKPGDSSHCSSRRSSAASSLIDLTAIERLTFPKGKKALLDDFDSQHLIVTALLNFVDSADYMISVKAMDALLLICAFPDEDAAANAVGGTALTAVVVDRLVKLFEVVPMDTDLAMIEEVKVNWVEAHHLHASGSSLPDFTGKAELVSFFSWLDFCDNLIKTSAETISEAVCEAIRETFLERCLEMNVNQIMAQVQDGENDPPITIVRLLSLITQCWVHVHSEGLANEFSLWLFGDNQDPELRDVITHPLKHTLLQLCKGETQEITLEALRLFEVVLDRPCDPILQSLVLGSLGGRGYYNAMLAESAITSWSDEEDEREKSKPGSALEISPTRSRSSVSPFSSLPPSRTMAPTNIARIVNAWLYLVPEDLRAIASDSAKDSGYEGYVRNAETQVADSFRRCGGFRWPREATFPDEIRSEASSDSRPEADADQAQDRHFYEGEFLSTLFDLLEKLLEHDYDINLQVTALLSRLSMLPHPYVHEYLLNPTIPTRPGVRTLHGTLLAVLSRAREETKGIDQLQRKIYVCRKTLLGSESDRLALNLTARETKIIDGLIILEEFGKEIAAITLVKYHMASTA